MILNHTILSLLLWLPLISGTVVLLANNTKFAKLSTISVLSVTAFLGFWLLFHFNYSSYIIQYGENHDWIPILGINYALGVDGISLLFVVLTLFVVFTAALFSYQHITKNLAHFFGLLLLSQGFMTGIFVAQDAVLFYMFWEAVLIPLFLFIFLWGNENATQAAVKFLIYTFLGSVLLLLAILYLHQYSHSFALSSFYNLRLPISTQYWLFGAFIIAFGIKIPIVPLHTWLPDAHTAAPAAGSVILAGLLLKVGAYGLLRFCLPVLPHACQNLAWLMVVLALGSIVYAALIALVQVNYKKLIAYTSIVHLSFVVLGFFAIFLLHNKFTQELILLGAIIIMVTHALSISALFLVSGVLYSQRASFQIKDFAALARQMPLFSLLVFVFILAVISFPGTSGFIGEFMVSMSLAKITIWLVFIVGVALVLVAGYMLWLFKRMFFVCEASPVGKTHYGELQDVRGTDKLLLLLFAGLIIAIGLYPEPLVNLLHISVKHLLMICLG